MAFVKYIFFIFVFCCSPKFICGQEIQGTVKTTDGKPISKVFIRPNYIKTDSSGKFVLKNSDSKFLFFNKDGFKPLAKKIEGESEFEIVLKSENESDKLIITQCSQINRGKKVGSNIYLYIPRKYKSNKSRDIDYTAFSIFSKTNKKIFLRGISGPNASSGYPDKDWLNSSSEVNIRMVNNGVRNIGLDFYGETKDSKYWRYIQVFDEYVYYIVDSLEAKIVFDKTINNSCSNVNRYFKD